MTSLPGLGRAIDGVLLHQRHACDPGLDAVIASSNHHAVGGADDVIEVLVALDLLDLRDVRPCHPRSSKCARSCSMSAAERTNDSATKSPPMSAANARSPKSLSVIAGSPGRAYVTLIPLRGTSSPDDVDLATTSPGPRSARHQTRHTVADDDLGALGDESWEVREIHRNTPFPDIVIVHVNHDLASLHGARHRHRR